MAKRLSLIVALAGIAILAVPSVANAQGVSGQCGIHFGDLDKINSSGAFYHARMGPRDGYSGGDMHCYGKFLVSQGRQPNGTPNPAVWELFNWQTWNLHTILALNGTAASCTGFGLAFAANAPAGAVAAWLTASAGVGCVAGVGYIEQTYLTAHASDPNYCGRYACNGPGRVPLN